MRGIVAVLILVILSASASAFVAVDHWGVYEDEPFYEFVENDVSLNVRDLQSNNDIKVVFTIPELGIRESKGPYDPEELQYTTVHKTLELPWDADYGEYVIRMTVTDSEGNKHIKHRFIEID
jgi:hypothetical protein